MTKILIIGYGIVGKNIEKELSCLKPDIYDKYTDSKTKKDGILYDIAFICVDTPYINENNPCDLYEVKNAIQENNAKIYVIKSTVLPKTTENLIKETNKNIIFSPEYYGNTHFSNNYEYDYTILGGDTELCSKVIQQLQNVYDCRHRFIISDSKTAELVKYMENTYLAMKVSFCNQFWKIAKELEIRYEILRELFVVDPRINPSNTFVFDDHPYWDSHCFNKDISAIASAFNAPFIKSIIDFNEIMKNDNNLYY